MAQLRLLQACRSMATAVLSSIVVVIVLTWPGHPSAQMTANSLAERQLAAELLIASGDVVRLNAHGLPSAYREGLRQRIEGALGVLPWLLRLSGDVKGADAVRTWQARPLAGEENRTRLADLLAGLSAAHPLLLAQFKDLPDTPTTRREARAIHQTYCAGCHDDAAGGDPEVSLPTRDLFVMAQEEDGAIFMARLINGVKGDETLQFSNPLTDAHLAALWRYYRSAKP